MALIRPLIYIGLCVHSVSAVDGFLPHDELRSPIAHLTRENLHAPGTIANDVLLASDRERYCARVTDQRLRNVHFNYHKVVSFHREFIQGLHSIPELKDAFLPIRGTLLAALRFGSQVGFLGDRFNFVDLDSDWLIFVEEDSQQIVPGTACSRVTAEILAALNSGPSSSSPTETRCAPGSWRVKFKSHLPCNPMFVCDAGGHPDNYVSTVTAEVSETDWDTDSVQRPRAVPFFADVGIVEVSRTNREARFPCCSEKKVRPSHAWVGVGMFCPEENAPFPKEHLRWVLPPKFRSVVEDHVVEEGAERSVVVEDDVEGDGGVEDDGAMNLPEDGSGSWGASRAEVEGKKVFELGDDLVVREFEEERAVPAFGRRMDFVTVTLEGFAISVPRRFANSFGVTHIGDWSRTHWTPRWHKLFDEETESLIAGALKRTSAKPAWRVEADVRKARVVEWNQLQREQAQNFGARNTKKAEPLNKAFKAAKGQRFVRADPELAKSYVFPLPPKAEPDPRAGFSAVSTGMWFFAEEGELSPREQAVIVAHGLSMQKQGFASVVDFLSAEEIATFLRNGKHASDDGVRAAEQENQQYFREKQKYPNEDHTAFCGA